MQALQLAELSSDALLVVRGSRVMAANSAARALFARFGRTRALEGADLDELWEESPAADGIAIESWPRRVLALVPGHAPIQLDVAATSPDEGGHFGVRVTPAGATPGAAAGSPPLEQLQAALDATSDAISVIDVETLQFTYFNDAVANLRGVPPQELSGKGPTVLNEYSEQELRDIYARAIAAWPGITTGEAVVRSRDGSQVRVETVRRAFRSAGRWFVIVVQRDISARHAAMQRLKLFREAMDHSVDVLALIDRETLSHLDVNRRGLDWTGLSYEQYLATDPWKLAWKGATADEYAARLDEAIALSPQPQVQAVMRLRGDGSEFPAEIVRSALMVDGRWIIASSARDISDRQAAHAAAERFRAAVDASGDAMIVIDAQSGTVVDANDTVKAFLGVGREQLVGASAAAADPHGGNETVVRETIRRLIDSHPQVEVQQIHRVREDGVALELERRRRAFRSGDRWFIYDSWRDVTQRALAERELHERAAELARSNRELEQFAYVTSHDLSEPLRMVASYMQLLERRYGAQLDADGREFIAYGVSGACRMKQLIDDLLTYSRVGRINHDMRQVPLQEPLDEALSNLAQAIRDAGATIERPPTLPTLECSRIAMMQLFQNLVANAIKFRHEAPPVVRIEAAHDPTGWTITVRDNGIGIDPQHFERIFVIFQRLHSRSDYEGTGIGLAICKKIVERHDGEIWVESQPGQGTAFKVRLPDRSAKNRNRGTG